MLNLVVVFSLAVLSSEPALTSDGAVVLQMRSAADGESVQTVAPLQARASSEEVAQAYDELRSMRARERTQVLTQMSSSMQAAMWRRHLLTTLVQHPEFTMEQRAVIQEALALLTPELLEVDSTNRRWGELVDLPLRRLTQRALAAFPEKTFARDLFTRLGPDVPVGSVTDQAATPAFGGRSLLSTGSRLIEANSQDCTCSITSDWCDAYMGYHCRNAWCMYKNKGCGTWLQYPCEGFCLASTG